MKFHHLVLAIMALFASVISSAATVTASPNIQFLYIDGNKAGSLLKSQRSFNVSASGQHQVLIRVSDIIVDGSEHHLFESDPIVVTFQGASEDIVISASSLKTPRDVQAFLSKPDIKVNTQSGQAIASRQGYLKQDGFLPGIRIEEDLAKYNASGQAASLPSLATVQITAPTTVMAAASAPAVQQQPNIANQIPAATNVNSGQAPSNMAEQMLQYWYSQSDQATKNRFIEWMKKQ